MQAVNEYGCFPNLWIFCFMQMDIFDMTDLILDIQINFKGNIAFFSMTITLNYVYKIITNMKPVSERFSVRR